MKLLQLRIVQGCLVSLIAVLAYKYWIRSDIRHMKSNVYRVACFGDELCEPHGHNIFSGDIFPWKTSMLGVSGATTASALLQADTVIDSGDWDLVVISLGVGDLRMKVSLGETLDHLETLVAKFHNHQIPLIFLGSSPPRIGDNWLMAIRDLCKRLGVGFVDYSRPGGYSFQSLELAVTEDSSFGAAIQPIVDGLRSLL